MPDLRGIEERTFVPERAYEKFVQDKVPVLANETKSQRTSYLSFMSKEHLTHWFAAGLPSHQGELDRSVDCRSKS